MAFNPRNKGFVMISVMIFVGVFLIAVLVYLYLSVPSST